MKRGLRENSRRWKRVVIKRGLLILSACLALVLLYPTQTVTVPAWRIRVVDEAGRPLQNEFVRQTWKNYSLELGGSDHGDDGWTDADGYVSFPERTTRASLLQRMFVPLRNTAALGPHASYGASANIMVWGGHVVPASVRYAPDKPLPQELVLPRHGTY
jgi:hypothetical protein